MLTVGFMAINLKSDRRAVAWFYGLGAMLLLVSMAGSHACGQDNPPSDQPQAESSSDLTEGRPYSINIQSTVVGQGHLDFPAEYTGANSMTPGAAVRETISFDVVGGVRLWRGAEFLGTSSCGKGMV